MLQQNAMVNPDLIIWSASMKTHVHRGEALLIHPVQSDVLRGPSRLICPLCVISYFARRRLLPNASQLLNDCASSLGIFVGRWAATFAGKGASLRNLRAGR